MSSKFIKKLSLFILWLLFGWFGAHRFFMKKYKSALLMILITVASIIFHQELILYLLARIVMIIMSGADLSIVILAIPMYGLALLKTSLVVIVIWWLIDIFIIYKFIVEQSKNEHQT